MSTFTVPVVEIRAVEPIPGADKIELAVVGDYRSVIAKGQFKPGDKAIYLPEAAVLPDALISELGLDGKLAGSCKNRIKAIRLRGSLSQGILYAKPELAGRPVGTDVADALGVTKYEPPVPGHMKGEVASIFDAAFRFDIENIKAYPDVLQDGEPVEMTEKIHGTFCGFGVIPGLDHPDLFCGDGVVYSKGLGAKGLMFKDNAANNFNIYVAAARGLDIHARIRSVFPGKAVHVLGEVYGHGVQDLTYGRKDRGYAAFDICIDGSYLDRDELAEVTRLLGIERVPVLYRGPFSRATCLGMTDGQTLLSQGQIREGIVVTPLHERTDPAIGRVILKSVSGDYLTRKGDATEFV
mgnify:CR=1 FL=1